MSKTIKLTICSVILIGIALSCNNEKMSYKIIEIPPKLSKKTNLSLIANDIEYIPLSTDSLLERINKIIFWKEYFYVKDNRSMFLKYDKEGRFITEIGKKGNGPGEYNYINDFTVEKETGRIYGVNYKFKRIFVFSINGDFLKNIDLSFDYPSRINSFSDGLLIYYDNSHGNNHYNLELMDYNGHVIKQFNNNNKFDIRETFVSFTSDCLFYNFNDKIYFKEIHSDSVFYIKDQRLKLNYVLNSGDKRFTNEVRTNSNLVIPGLLIEKMSEFIIQSNIIESKTFFLYEYLYQKKSKIAFYNKKTHDCFELKGETGFINNLDGGPNIVFKSIIKKNTLLSWIDAYQLKAHVASEAFKNSTPLYPQMKKELEKLANSLDENDNPVLMLVKLKE